MHCGKDHKQGHQRSQQFGKNCIGVLDLSNIMLKQNPDYARKLEASQKPKPAPVDESKLRATEFAKKHPELMTNNK